MGMCFTRFMSSVIIYLVSIFNFILKEEKCKKEREREREREKQERENNEKDKHTLCLIKRIRIIPRRMAQPSLIRSIKDRIGSPDGDRHRRVVEKVPYRRVAQPLLALHPLLGLVAYPGRHGHEEGVDAAVGPLLEEALLEGPFCCFELLLFTALVQSAFGLV